jgi:hypothetical protein
MEVERNSFADARINGYLVGILQRFSVLDDVDMIHDLDRTEDYIHWFAEARKAGFNAELVHPIPKDFCEEDFKKGFLYGWKGGYNHGHSNNNHGIGFEEVYKIESFEPYSESKALGSRYGFNDGEPFGRN